MAAFVPRRAFATSVVLTVAVLPACGCRQADSPPKSHDTSWSVDAVDAGQCEATREYDCPRGASCNPPPPKAYACPPGVTRFPATVVRDATGHCGVADSAAQRHVEVPCPPE